MKIPQYEFPFVSELKPAMGMAVEVAPIGDLPEGRQITGFAPKQQQLSPRVETSAERLIAAEKEKAITQHHTKLTELGYSAKAIARMSAEEINAIATDSVKPEVRKREPKQKLTIKEIVASVGREPTIEDLPLMFKLCHDAGQRCMLASALSVDHPEWEEKLMKLVN